jgi:hypothetical protein
VQEYILLLLLFITSADADPIAANHLLERNRSYICKSGQFPAHSPCRIMISGLGIGERDMMKGGNVSENHTTVVMEPFLASRIGQRARYKRK